MQYQVKKHSKDEFYDIFSNWLISQKFPLINKEVLPENVFVMYVNDVPCYSIWVYFTDSRLAWLAFPASNRNVSYKQKQNGLPLLINHVCDYLKKKKILTVFTTSGTENVISALEQNKFEIGDSGISHYLKKL
jgi:hypothetical protein